MQLLNTLILYQSLITIERQMMTNFALLWNMRMAVIYMKKLRPKEKLTSQSQKC